MYDMNTISSHLSHFAILTYRPLLLALTSIFAASWVSSRPPLTLHGAVVAPMGTMQIVKDTLTVKLLLELDSLPRELEQAYSRKDPPIYINPLVRKEL